MCELSAIQQGTSVSANLFDVFLKIFWFDVAFCWTGNCLMSDVRQNLQGGVKSCLTEVLSHQLDGKHSLCLRWSQLGRCHCCLLKMFAFALKDSCCFIALLACISFVLICLYYCISPKQTALFLWFTATKEHQASLFNSEMPGVGGNIQSRTYWLALVTLASQYLHHSFSKQ